MLALVAVVLLIATACPLLSAFYVPGVTPKAYHSNDRVPLLVNKIVSENTQLPFAYGDLPFVCTPKDGVKRTWLNLGEVLRGDRLMSSDYELIVGRNTQCEQLCTVTVSEHDADEAKRLVQEEYRVEWIVDNLPGATVLKYNASSETSTALLPYFPLGQVKGDQVFLNNHVTLQLLYQSAQGDQRYIVGFEVYPASYADPSSCDKAAAAPMKQIGTGKTSITYTYSVIWKEATDITWATRWDRYLQIFESHIHWYSISNSLVITMFLTGIVAMIMLRTLRRDISSYNSSTDEDVEALDEDSIGWKLCHGDVFRPPKFTLLLAPLLGSGVQCLVMVAGTIVLSTFGLLNPSFRGGLVSYGIAFYVLAGSVAGFASARMYKVLKGQQWFRNALMTATLIPSILFVVLFILNLFVWGQQSSSAIPFGTFFALIAMWFGVSTPLVFAGAVFGARRPIIDHPVRTHQIPRQIPDQPWYLELHISMLVGGLMPFAVIFIELFFIFKSIWSDQYYYMFGFLTLVFLILVLTTVEIAIVITYFSLCSEDYRWWWKSFAVSAASGVYVFLYSIFYYFTRLKVTGFVPAIVYFGHSLMICMVYGLCMGTIGFFATFFFIRKIYAAIKVD
ncbi:transmembrane 9 superfamily protein member 4 [Lichtheimia corymbifera JMRC:FSU:9682]|uniref:Transmembrane 9 superfamily member n=1 Tax=Lichtheimia corymbifera JMRC:FSU:9682 TaxID=1263082 RepID=A0A068RLA1_9FUNG|nr:transmembrane 9 superfamily protein member 4 [Lichtheimia corymbifera JMRC:FSU:9682]